MNYSIEPLQLPQVADIYTQYLHRHFPANEIKPLKHIERMWDMGSYKALAMWAGTVPPRDMPAALENLAAYAFLATAPGSGMILLDYFAVLEDFRGQGAGSLFLRAMGQKFPEYKGILIETEDVDYARDEKELLARQKRDSFYEKNGVMRTGIRSSVYGVHYAIWNLPLTETAGEAESKKGLEDIYHIMATGEKYGKNVHIFFRRQ